MTSAARPRATDGPGGDRLVAAATTVTDGSVMNSPSSIVIRNSRLESSAVCLVCGNDISAGEGLTARYLDRTLHFKCQGCLSRFEAEPDRYLAGHEPGCCKDEHESSPASDWRCD